MTQITFGVGIPASAACGGDPVRDAAHAEAAGFDFVSASDHPGVTAPNFETWTMMAWMAAATTRIGVASRVLGVPFRNPALLAKMAETFQRLSGGRLILGLGAGSGDGELRSYGVEVAEPRAKIAGLAEAVTIIRGMWTEPTFTHRGSIYRTSKAELEPKPVRPIPIWLGTFGPRGLALTGRLADGWIPSLGYRPEDELPSMVAAVVDAARAAGRNPDGITRGLNVRVDLDADPATAPGDVLSGPAERITERLLGFTAIGFNAFNFLLPAADRARHTEQLAGKVLPAVRENASPTGASGLG